MPRSQSDREDLLREATALVERIQLQVAGFDEPIVGGFRRDGSVSFFFGGDPVYQFNTANEFRRGYIDGLLYKAEHGQLIALRRERGAGEVILVRTELCSNATQALLKAVRAKLTKFHVTLSALSFTILGQVPADSNIARRMERWLSALPAQIRIAARPNVQ